MELNRCNVHFWLIWVIGLFHTQCVLTLPVLSMRETTSSNCWSFIHSLHALVVVETLDFDWEWRKRTVWMSMKTGKIFDAIATSAGMTMTGTFEWYWPGYRFCQQQRFCVSACVMHVLWVPRRWKLQLNESFSSGWENPGAKAGTQLPLLQWWIVHKGTVGKYCCMECLLNCLLTGYSKESFTFPDSYTIGYQHVCSFSFEGKNALGKI